MNHIFYCGHHTIHFTEFFSKLNDSFLEFVMILHLTLLGIIIGAILQVYLLGTGRE